MTYVEESPEKKKINQYISNFNNTEYDEYLDNFKKTLEDRKKCRKNKKCAFDFVVNKKHIIKKKDSQVIYDITLPEYIIVDNRLKEIHHELNGIDMEIRFLQNILNLDSDKKMIEKYKTMRKEYLELEKEQKILKEYIVTVNNEDEIKNKKVELEAKLRNIKNEKLVLFNQVQLMFLQKSNPNFSKTDYHNKIKEYINNSELDKVKEELSNLNKYSLKTDRLFFNSVRDVETGRINYIVDKLPDIVKKRTTTKKKIIKKSSKKTTKSISKK